MSRLGSFLKEERERQQLTLRDISDKTAIRTYILEVLEEGRFDELPSYVHAHGFLAQYAKVLGLDFNNVIKPMFDAECPKEGFGGEHQEPEEHEVIRQSDFSPKPSMMKVALIILVLAVVVGGVIFAVKKMGENQNTEPTPTATFGTSTSYTPPVQEPVATDPTAMEETDTDLYGPDGAEANDGDNVDTEQPVAAVSTPNRVLLRFNAECWVNYLSDDGTSGEFIAIAGTERYVTFEHYFRLHLGSAGALSVVYNDNVTSGLGPLGQPMRNLYFVRETDGTLSTARTAPTN